MPFIPPRLSLREATLGAVGVNMICRYCYPVRDGYTRATMPIAGAQGLLSLASDAWGREILCIIIICIRHFIAQLKKSIYVQRNQGAELQVL